MSLACSRVSRMCILRHLAVHQIGHPDALKQKLTITVDADLLPVAKWYARSRGVSLSSLVEQSLRAMAGENMPTFSSRWRGKFQAAEHEGDPRYDALANKYLQ